MRKWSKVQYVINFPKHQLSQKQKSLIDLIAAEIKEIKEQIPQLDEIILHGGAVLSILYNKPINDLDFLYTLKPKKEFITKRLKKKYKT